MHGVVYENGLTYEGDLLNEKPHGSGKESSKLYVFAGRY
jgi:hypothetical protein